MTTRLRRTNFLLTGAMALMLGACSPASAPAATTSPSGRASTPARTATAATGTSVPSTNGGATAGSAGPCSLLTQAEVDTAAGQPLGPGAQIGALDDCQWSTSDFAGSVELDVGDWTTIKAKSTTFGLPMVAVPGVGDEALTFNQDGNAAQLYVRKGTTGFLLLLGGGQYIGTLPDLGLAQEKVLAAAVLGRQ